MEEEQEEEDDLEYDKEIVQTDEDLKIKSLGSMKNVIESHSKKKFWWVDVCCVTNRCNQKKEMFLI